jgi:YgiT-type zinc finger domain-containing protein
MEAKETKAMKTCPFCKGDIETRKVSHVHKWGNEYYLFENVQTEVCRQCGEIFFYPETLKLMDEYVKGDKKSEKRISIPVIKMPDMAVA